MQQSSREKLLYSLVFHYLVSDHVAHSLMLTGLAPCGFSLSNPDRCCPIANRSPSSFERLGHALLQQRKLLESTLPTLAFGAVPVAARDN